MQNITLVSTDTTLLYIVMLHIVTMSMLLDMQAHCALLYETVSDRPDLLAPSRRIVQKTDFGPRKTLHLHPNCPFVPDKYASRGLTRRAICPWASSGESDALFCHPTCGR